METLISNRLKSLGQSKKYYKERLKFINPTQDSSIVDKLLSINFNSQKFGKSTSIIVSDQPNGIELQSNLANNEHDYLYLTEVKELGLILEFLKAHEDLPLSINVNGYHESTLDIELFLIFIKQNGDRVNVKVKLGGQELFTVNKQENINSIKLAIRVKGNGFAYIHNPHIYSKSLELIGNYSTQSKKVKKIKDMNVIFIGDEFTTRSFEPEFNLIKVTPDNWESEVMQFQPDFFFCESAWLGNNGAWQNKVGTGGPRDNTILLSLVSWCKTNEIPTVFWNKEDPFHFNAFIETAKHFDHVFTTDSNSIQKYKDMGCSSVYSFPFAAQPKYHNPIEKYERLDKVVFAGAYYGDKFPERKQVMDNMIQISGEYGIDIYDRNYNNPESPNQFPTKFKDFIKGTLKGDEIEKAYKGYKLSLNVNSIVDSPTMFARRVFELLASNTPVISSKSLGIDNMFGELVIATNNFNELQIRIDKYFKDKNYYMTNRLQTLRKVLSEHTYTNRVKMMLDTIGFKYVDEKNEVTVVGVVKSKDDYNILLEQYNRQKWENKKLVILIDIFDGYLDLFNENNNIEIKTYLIDYLHHYSSLNDIIDTRNFVVFVKTNYYCDYYLTDMMLATMYIPNAIIVKNIGDEYTFVTSGKISESLLRKDQLLTIKPVQLLEKIETDKSLSSWFKFGIQFFNIDNFNIITNIKNIKNLQTYIKRTTV